MHTKMEIKSEELDISDDESTCFDIIHRNNPVVATDIRATGTENMAINDSKIYTPLKPVNFERFKSPGRLSTPLIKSSAAHTGINRSRSNGYKSPSPKKLGVKTFGRSSYNILKSPRKEQNLDINQKELTLDNLEAVAENGKSVECSHFVIPDPNTSPMLNSNNRNYESDDDIFASQELENRNEIISNINVESISQELTPLKATREKLKNAIMKDEKLFLTPQSVGKTSISSDSEFDRVCDEIKNNNFDPGHYSFETMDLLNEFDDLADETNNKILSDVLGLSVDNGENRNEPLTDPLAHTPQKVNGLKQGNAASPVQKRTRKRKLLPHERRRSTRLQEKLINVSKESDSSSADDELKEIREKIKQVEERDAIPPTVMEKLRNLDIKLDREPLPQHQLETYISRAASLDIKKAFVQYGPMKKGSFSMAEDKIIKENWARFCINHNWDPQNVKPFLNVRVGRRMIISNEQRIKFVQFIAQGLPWRLLYSVYLHFQTLFAKNKHEGKYTPEEDAKILVYMEKEAKYSQKCMKLAQLLNRKKSSIRARYLHLKNQRKKHSEKTKIQWDVPLIEKFLKHLLNLTLSKDIYELKDAVIPKVVWFKLEKTLKIPHDELMSLWLYRLHAQLFCTRPIYEIDIKIMLIEYMYVKGISNKRELIWPSISKYFDGFTPHYLSRAFCTLVKSAPSKRKKNLAGVIGWLYERKIPQLSTKINDRCLPRLIYKNGKIEIIEESLSTSSSSSSLDSSESD